MQVTRGFGFVGIVGACWFVAAGCSSDDDAVLIPSEGGSGGDVASGGRIGTGGKATGGKGGSATGGKGGTATGGKGGSSGSGGSATGGSSGSGGSATGGSSGSGGAGGATDSGTKDSGDAGNQTSKSCAYQCGTDRDCLTGSDAGADGTYKCNSVRKRCENPIEVCDSNADCIALASAVWIFDCTSDADCFGDVCVDAGGYGKCAPLPAPDCSFPPQKIVRQRFGSSDGGTVEVCGSTAGRCNAHRCTIGCNDDPPAFCSVQIGRGLTCNVGNGLCECATNAECTATGVSVCNTTTHHCECATSADCANAPGGNVCVNGTCGCSGTTLCNAAFRNATSLCE